ncbi:hypothetical protein, partial [Glycomyces sp. MUSA5-2]|uniref:hypothetical protein n=1 Tax=Glycomyces sp. MUSA5-2 TaxID=2053002 RepID=UPI00300ADF46
YADLARVWHAEQTLRRFVDWLREQIREHGLPDAEGLQPDALLRILHWTVLDPAARKDAAALGSVTTLPVYREALR